MNYLFAGLETRGRKRKKSSLWPSYNLVRGRRSFPGNANAGAEGRGGRSEDPGALRCPPGILLVDVSETSS